MALSTRVRDHIRNNLWGIVAVFIALGGTAAALPGRNTVNSGDIKPRGVRSSDLAARAVTDAKLAPGAVDSASIADGSVTGDDIRESSLDLPQGPTTLPPDGPAGGDLAGDYPNPEVVESELVPGGDLGGTLANAQLGAGSVGDPEMANRTRSILIPAQELSPPIGSPAPAEEIVNGSIPALSFDPSTDEEVIFATRVPSDRAAGSQLTVALGWSSTSAAIATPIWRLDYMSLGVSDLVNGAFTQGNTGGSAQLQGANRLNSMCCLSVPNAAIANGELLVLQLVRDADNAADNLGVDARVHMIEISYSAER